jgi:hypothetical protein
MSPHPSLGNVLAAMHSSKDAGTRARTEKWIYKATTKPSPLKDDRALEVYAIASHAIQIQSGIFSDSSPRWSLLIERICVSRADLNSDFSLAGRTLGSPIQRD